MKRMITVILTCCALALALVGCGGASAKATDADSLKGFWELDPNCELGFDAALSLYDADMAELVLQDSFLEGTWKADGSSASVNFEGAGTVNLYVQDGKLIYGSEDGAKLVFVKSSLDESDASAKADEESGEAELLTLDDDELDSLSSLDNIEIQEEDIKDITPVTIADDDDITIQVTGKGTDFTGDPGYRLTVKNKSKKTLYIVPKDSFKIDGKSIEAGLGDVIDPGDEIDSFLYFSSQDVGGGADKLTKVEGEISVGDDDTSEELKSFKFNMD